MKTIESRIKKIEDMLNVNKKPLTVTIVFFGDRQLPPDSTEGGIIKKYVHYTDLLQNLEIGQCAVE